MLTVSDSFGEVGDAFEENMERRDGHGGGGVVTFSREWGDGRIVEGKDRLGVVCAAKPDERGQSVAIAQQIHYLRLWICTAGCHVDDTN